LVFTLRQGTTFYKLPYLKGKPHKRQFKVSEDLRRLKWCFLPSRNFMQRARDPVRPATKQVFLTEVQDIRMGMRTANFKRIENVEKFQGRAAFSIITQVGVVLGCVLCGRTECVEEEYSHTTHTSPFTLHTHRNVPSTSSARPPRSWTCGS
jgi:hypothetical protein